jgi:Spy/CpxP family protein refolding chaperone
MNTFRRFALAGSLCAGVALAGPALAQDCDAMLGEIDQLLQTATLTDEQRQQVLDLRDEGMAETTRAGGDCTDTLQQALDILKGNN